MFAVSPAVQYIIHHGQKGSNGGSPRIWGRLYDELLSPDRGRNPKIDGDDFTNFAGFDPGDGGDTAASVGGFGIYADTATTGSKLVQLAADLGVVQLEAAGVAHHEVTMQVGGFTGAPFSIRPGVDSLRAFECRIRIPSGNDSAQQGAFVGVAAAGSAANNFMANTTMALKDANLIGFHLPVGAADVIRPVWRKSGSDVVDTVGVVKTYTPGDWVKLGFLFNPLAEPRWRFQFFVDNEVVESLVPETVEDSLPKDAQMSPILSVKSLSTDGGKLDCDWIGFGNT